MYISYHMLSVKIQEEEEEEEFILFSEIIENYGRLSLIARIILIKNRNQTSI